MKVTLTIAKSDYNGLFYVAIQDRFSRYWIGELNMFKTREEARIERQGIYSMLSFLGFKVTIPKEKPTNSYIDNFDT